MDTTTTREYKIKNTEKCFRFKQEALDNHAPPYKGIYELVTFDANQNPQVLYIGAAFEKTINQSLQGHLMGTLEPAADKLLQNYPNLYFDFIAEMNAKSQDDAQDIYWWLVQKHKPPFNDVAGTQPSQRPGTVQVTELD